MIINVHLARKHLLWDLTPKSCAKLLNIMISPLASQIPVNHRWIIDETHGKQGPNCRLQLTLASPGTRFKNEQQRRTPNGWKPSQVVAQRHLQRRFLRSRLHTNQGATPVAQRGLKQIPLEILYHLPCGIIFPISMDLNNYTKRPNSQLLKVF